ncbi:MAG: insulinase family protein [Gemmatimonadetes bacterium]|nr:insulinase family protein [Gemmatimonadota bacterium]
MSIDRTQEPQPGAIRPFHFPAVHRMALGNALTVLVAPRNALPVVTVRMTVSAGAGSEQPGEEGLARLAANALEGGTGRLRGEALAWELERLGLQLETWTTWDALHLSCTAVGEQLPAALALLAEIVRTPAFPEPEVARMRAEQLAELLQRQVEPRALADDMAAHFLYADASPYSRPLLGRMPALEALDSPAVRRFHARRFAPGAAALVLAGDVQPATAVALVEQSFGDWAGANPVRPEVPAGPRLDQLNLQLVDRPGAVQSELRLGHVGVARSHPDYFNLLVMNAILGGAFTSRLNLCLRERYGFTYGVRSGFSFRRSPGPFLIQTAVGTEVTTRAIQETLRELHDLLRDGPTDSEVAAARDYLAGIFPLELQTTEQLAGKLAELVVHDLPDDYFEHYRARILAVTPADVLRVAREHVRPERLTIVVVGEAETLEPELTAAGIAPVARHSADSVAALT